MNNLEIKKQRKLLSLTQQELADLIGVSKNTIVNYEKGLKIPDSKIPILTKALYTNVNIENQNQINIVNEPQSEYVNLSGYDKKIEDLKKIIEEKKINLEILPSNHPERKQVLEIIKIYEERLKFTIIAKENHFK